MFGNRPTFGGTSGFGGFGTNTSTTAFGSSSFGRPAFGTPQTTASSTPFGSGTSTNKTSLFGQTTPATGGLFGSSQSTGFGSTGTSFGSGGGGGLFGTTNTQTNTSGGLFGSNASNSTFNTNQNQTRPFSFGTTTTSSGAGGTSLFGTNNNTAGGNLFSSSLGQSSSGTVIKYNPVSGTDTMTRGGATTNIQTKIEVITAMKEYENRSLEELRVEDYLAGRKGPQQGQQPQQQQGFGFGQIGQQNKFGMNQPATSSNWLSGSNTGSGGLFGTKPAENKPLFGTSQSTGFGTSTSGGGLFGSSNPAPFGQSTTAPSNTGFSFGQSNPNKGFSFGQTTSAAPLFGQPTATQAGTTFGSSGFNFGNQAVSNQQQGGLFGAQKPAFGSTSTNTSLFSNKPTNTGFGGFGGAASAASPFGTTNTSTSGGLFGSANQNKTGFSLGTSNTGFGTGTSTFGSGGIFSANNNQPKPGGLTFGSSGGFGTNTASTGFSFNQPSTGGGLFGNTQGTTGGGLFGNTNTGLNTGNAFGSSGFGMNTMQPNLMSGGLNFNNTNNNLMNPNVVNNNNNNINNLIKALTHNPFGISSLLKDVSTPTGKADELLNSPTSSANNANATKSSVSDKTPTYVLPSSSAIHIRPKPIGHNRLTNLTDDSKKSFLFAGLDEKNENSPDDPFKIKPFPSVKRLNLKVFKNKNSANNSNSSGTGQNTTTNSIINGNLNPGTPTSPGFQDFKGTLTPLHDNSPTPDIIKGRSNIKRLQIPNKNQFNDTLAELNVMNKLKSTDAVADLDVSDFNKENNVSLFDPPSIDELHDLPDKANTSITPHPAGIKLTRIGYYTIPSMEDLKEMVDSDGNCFVENFTVGRYGYGNICFQGITNVIGLDLDSFIFIVRKEVEVYPEGVTKPTVGEELNKPAFITLDCVWPVDKTTHEVIKLQERLDAMGWAQYLERQCLKMESSFVEYRPETGSWVFKVKHFSKYGLQDDESEATVATPQQAAAEGVGAKVPPPTQKPMPQTSGAELAAKTPTSLANFSTNIPLFGGRASQGPPAVALTSPPLLSSAPPQYGIDSTPSSTRRNLKVFLDGSTTDLGEEEIFTTGEESNNCASLCPLSPSAERLTLSTKAPARAIQSLKSQLFFSDFDSEVTNEDDYKGTSLPYPREKSEKRERELFGEEFMGPSEDWGKAPVVPVKSSSKKLFLGDESRLDTSRGDVSNLSSVPMETGSVRGKKTYLEPQREEREDSEPVTITSKAKLREPRTEYQLLKSIPDPHFELGRETMHQLEYKIPYEGSQAFNFSKGTADAGTFMGRSFRVGWGPSLTLVHVGPALLGSSSEADHNEEESVDGESEEPHYLFDTDAGFSEGKRSEIPRSIKTERFDIMIEKLHIRSQVPEKLGESSLQIGPMLEACLQNVLRCSIINFPDSVKDLTIDIGSSSSEQQQPMSESHTSVFPATCHYFAPEEGINLLHQLVLTASQIDDNEYRETKLATVFELCAALWGRLDFYSPDIDGESEYALEHARKEALSVWLEEVSSESVEMEAERALENDSEETYLDAVFSHLTARQISRACDVCLDKGDNHLALLLSQSCMSDDIPRQIMKEQLTNWAWSGVDTHMSASRLALYALVGGQAIHESSQGKINTCLGLDWRRCLAVLMWYICPTTSSISEVLKEYEKASGLVSSKEPPYCEDPKPIYLANQPLPENIKVNYDVCFQLLKLYVDRSHSLETLLETSSITSDPLDVTTSWLLWCVLQSLGYTLLPPAKIEALNTSMAALLESHGSWHWAAFVILFLKDEEKRKREVLELLTKHLLVEGEEGRKDPFYVEKEHFILKELKLPEPWINKAKAIRAKSLELVDEETWYLIKAGEYNEAHKLILETIAPNAIINEDHEFFLSYLNEFEDEIIERVVDWQNGGAIYRAYLEVVQQVNELRESQHPTVSKVERLRPRLMALCLRLNNLTSSTAVHRLSISEMSRLVVSVLRAILSEDPDGVRVLAQQVTALPLTHECALEELNHITHQYLTTLSHLDAVSMEIS